MLTQKELKEVFSYNSDNGLFTRILKTSSSCEVGDIAKCHDGDGYLVLRINARLYRCHRLAWLYVHGSFPKESIDHINGIRDDNRLPNLRDVSAKDNQKNMKLNSKNTTGISGVWWHSQNKNWCADIGSRDSKVRLGSHASFFEACCARKSAEVKLNYHENHGRR